jgi:hypothetical protein
VFGSLDQVQLQHAFEKVRTCNTGHIQDFGIEASQTANRASSPMMVVFKAGRRNQRNNIGIADALKANLFIEALDRGLWRMSCTT